MLCLFLCAAMVVGLFVPLVPPLGVCVCSTSPPGGNQVDGLPPAPVFDLKFLNANLQILDQNYIFVGSPADWQLAHC